MALYQPSNITPSVFAGINESTVAVGDNINITWQVNGTSALTQYTITIMNNDEDSTFVHTTGALTQGCPFYGTDSQGNTVFFTYSPGVTWSSWGLTDGNEYKISISQTYMAGSVPVSVTQYSPQVFRTRTAPSLTISSFTTPVSSISQTFSASYSQAQGDSLDSVQWTLYNNTTGQTVDSTGVIVTGVLEYTYNGFFPDNNYTLTCQIQTSSGVTAQTSSTFAVDYDEPGASGGVGVSCESDGSVLVQWGAPVDIPGTASSEAGYSINTDNTIPLKLWNNNTITWNTVDGDPMSFSAPYALAWSGKVPRTAMYGGNVPLNSQSDPLTGEVFGVAINPSGTLAVVTGDFPGYAKLYSITSAGTLQYLQDILGSGYAALNDYAFCASFSPDGQYLLIGGGFTNYAIIYTVSSQTVNFLDYVPSQSGTAHYLDGIVTCAAWTSDSAYFVIGGQFTGHAKYYNIDNNMDIYYKQDLLYTAGIPLPSPVTCIAISQSGESNNQCIIGTESNSGSWLLSSGIATFLHILDSNMLSVAISPDGEYAACAFTGKIQILQQGTLRWNLKSQITNFIGYSPTPVALQFLAIGSETYLFVAGQYSQTSGYPYNMASFLNQYPFSNGTVGDRQTILYGDDFNVFSNKIMCMSISSNMLIVGGTIPNYAQYYTISSRNYEILSINNGAVSVRYDGNLAFSVYSQNTLVQEFPAVSSARAAALIITPAAITIYYYADAYIVEIEKISLPNTISLPNISQIQLSGFQDCKYVYVTSDTDYAFTANTPPFDASTLFLAQFSDGLQAGTISPSGTISNALYRISSGTATLLGIVPSTNTYLKDFGVASRTPYTYQLYYITNNVFSSAVKSQELCFQLNGYLLIEAAQNADTPTMYNVLNTWYFAANLNAGSVSNNNSPSFLQNFTPYRMKQPSSQMGKSGTLSALLSVPANGTYADTVTQMEALYQLSQTQNTLFLKDMKGNVYMITISGPITQSINNKTYPLEVTVNIPWEEVGDASGLAIVQMQDSTMWRL